MLVLSRKVSEAIILTGGIRIMVTSIDANRVSLGVEAPSNVEVMREELLPPDYDPSTSNHQTLTRRARYNQLNNRKLET